MELAMDVAHQVVEALFGPGSGVPWWAWVAPLVMIFGRLLMPSVVTEASGPRSGKKGKKPKKKGKK